MTIESSFRYLASVPKHLVLRLKNKWNWRTGGSPKSKSVSKSNTDARSGISDVNIVYASHKSIPKDGESIGVMETIRSSMGNWGDRTAFECAATGLAFTHNDVFIHARSLARSFTQAGLKSGDIVTVALPNSPLYPVVYYALLEAQLVGNLINPWVTPKEIQSMVERVHSKAVIASPELIPNIVAMKKLDHGQKIISSGGAEKGVHSLKDMITANTVAVRQETWSPQPVDRARTAMIFWTSGTTGEAKPVMVTQASMVAQLHQVAHPSVSPYTPGEGVALGLLPFFHAYPNVMVLRNGSFVGSKVVTVPKFDAESFVQAVKKFKPSVIPVCPALLKLLGHSNRIAKEDLKELHTLQCGGAQATKATIEKFLEKTNNKVFFQASYGSTELGLSFITPVSSKNVKIDSLGKLLPGTKAKVIDDHEVNLSWGQSGELCVKGPQMLNGYFADDSRTLQSIDSRGWYRTGDQCSYDNEGFFYFHDRMEDIIVTQGKEVSPAFLESLLKSHPGIRDAAVIGVNQSGIGQVPKAFIVVRDDALKPHDVEEFIKKQLPSHMSLQGGVKLVKEIPRNPIGKVCKYMLT